MDIDGHDLRLSKGNVKRIGRSCHENERISGDAAKLMAMYLEEYAEEMWSVASDAAEHADRKTIQEEDVHMAMKMEGKLR